MSEFPEMRIGDRERLVAQDRLRDAYGQGALDLDELDERLDLALRAKTSSDLVPILSDLPAPAGGEVSLAKPDDEGGLGAGGGGEDDEDEGVLAHLAWFASVILPLSVLGAIGWFLASTGAIDTFTVFGSTVVTVDAESDDLRLLTIFGSTEVVVAEGESVRNSTISIFGSSECDRACTSAGVDGAPSVSGLTLFGSVEFVYADEAGDDD